MNSNPTSSSIDMTRLKANLFRRWEAGLSYEEVGIYPKPLLKRDYIYKLYSSSGCIIIGSKLETSHYPLEWFPKDDPNYIGTKYIDAKMRGSLTAEVIIDTGEENGWQDANRLEKLDRLTKELEGYSDGKSFIGKIVSLNSIVKETNRALHENNQSFYRVPNNQALVSQELLLFENSGSDDLEDIVDSQFSKVRVTHKLPWKDSIDSIDILNHIKGRYEESFRDSTITPYRHLFQYLSTPSPINQIFHRELLYSIHPNAHQYDD